MSERTLKQDRELAVNLAEKLGHEMGGWGWWACLPKRKAHCKLCGDWIGIKEVRNWEYSSTYYSSAGITGTAIEEDYEWRKSKCSGVAYRARERSRWQKRVKRILSVIKNHSDYDAARIICGEKP